MTEVYSVEYRLMQDAPFPGVLQDAAAVYTHVVRREHQKNCKFILIGDSAGGNLVLALARWLRDEGHLPMPDGLLLLSVRHIAPLSHVISSLTLPTPPAILRYIPCLTRNPIILHSPPQCRYRLPPGHPRAPRPPPPHLLRLQALHLTYKPRRRNAPHENRSLRIRLPLLPARPSTLVTPCRTGHTW